MDVDLVILGVSYAVLGANIFILVTLLLNRLMVIHKYLLVLYGAHLISVIDDIYVSSEWWKLFPQFNHVYLPFVFLVTPAFYLYLKALTCPQENKKFKVKSRHWLGFVVVLFFCLPYLLLNSSTKLERLIASPETLDHIGFTTIGPYLALLLYIPFCMMYLIMALRLIIKNKVSLKTFFSNIDNKDLSWIRWMIIVFLLALVFSALQLYLPDSLTEGSSWRFIYLSLGYLWLMIFAILASKQQPMKVEESKAMSKVELITDTKKYLKSQLSQNEIERIEKKLIYAMEISKLYRMPGLTLRHLADELKISQNKISQVLNNSLSKGFYDFVNSWRIKDACLMMEEQSKSILEIAYDVGYNSKSTFNNSFKKYTGLTPSQFKKM